MSICRYLIRIDLLLLHFPFLSYLQLLISTLPSLSQMSCVCPPNENGK